MLSNKKSNEECEFNQVKILFKFLVWYSPKSNYMKILKIFMGSLMQLLESKTCFEYI